MSVEATSVFISKDEYEAWQLELTTASEAANDAVARLPKGFKKTRLVEAFEESFELIGGVPRLAMWANQNPGAFYKLYARIQPQQIETHGEHIIHHVLPKSKLDE